MKIIVIGLGKRGSAVAAMLVDEGYDVTVVDVSEKAVNDFTDRHDASGVVGSGVSTGILRRAGAETADMVVSFTGSDETNILSCMLAKKCGAAYAAAGMEAPDLGNDGEVSPALYGIDGLINSPMETASFIARGIEIPFSVKERTVLGEDIVLSEMPVGEDDLLTDRSLWEMKSEFPDTDYLVTSVLRGKSLVIPDGKFRLRSGDRVELVATRRALAGLCKKLGYASSKIRNILIVGCGVTGYYLTRFLSEKKYHLSILDFDRENCRRLNEAFPEAEVMYGDAANVQSLIESGLDRADACLLLTGDDRTNLIVSMFAHSEGKKNVVVKINDDVFGEMLKRVDMGMCVSESEITAEKVLGIARNLSVRGLKTNQLCRLYRIADNRAEAVEFEAAESFSHTGVPLRSPDFRLKKNLLLACLIREGRVMIPNGDTFISPGDRVVVVSDIKNVLSDLEDIFCAK